jgi:hypothetical protein
VAVVEVGLVQVLTLTLVVQMNLGAAQDNTNTNRGMIGTTRIDVITERGTRIAETDDVVILRDVSITTGNKIEKIGDTTETDEMEASRVNTQEGRIDRKTMEGTRIDTNTIVEETVKGAEIGREAIGGIGIGTTIMTKRKVGIDIRIAITVAEMGRETIGGTEIEIDIQIAITTTTGIGTTIILKRKTGIEIDIRIAIIAITTKTTVTTEEAVPASTVSTRRVTGVRTKNEANRIAAVRTRRRTMKNVDGNAETKMKLEDVITNGKTKTKNDIESTTSITSEIGRRRATPLAKEETTIAVVKSGIVLVEVEARLA